MDPTPLDRRLEGSASPAGRAAAIELGVLQGAFEFFVGCNNTWVTENGRRC